MPSTNLLLRYAIGGFGFGFGFGVGFVVMALMMEVDACLRGRWLWEFVELSRIVVSSLISCGGTVLRATSSNDWRRAAMKA